MHDTLLKPDRDAQATRPRKRPAHVVEVRSFSEHEFDLEYSSSRCLSLQCASDGILPNLFSMHKRTVLSFLLMTGGMQPNVSKMLMVFTNDGFHQKIWRDENYRISPSGSHLLDQMHALI